MNWYYAEAGQQKGPVTDEQFDGLIKAGVVKPDTLVWREGLANWQPYSVARSVAAPPPINTGVAGVVCSQCGRTFNPDEVIALGGALVCAACKPVGIQLLKEGVGAGAPGATMTAEELAGRDYEVDIGDLINKGWTTLTKNFGIVLGATLLVYLVSGIGGVIPWLGPIISLIIQGPLLGGLYLFYLKQIRTGEGTVGDAFSGFGPRFTPLMLTQIVASILTGLCILPGVVCLLFAILPAIMSGGKGGGAATVAAGGILIVGGILLLIGLVGAVYLGVSWAFALPLVADKRMDFWPALKLSRQMVGKHWGMVFLTMFVGGIIAMLGLLGCIVGVFVTLCIYMGMVTHLYETIFGPLAPADR